MKGGNGSEPSGVITRGVRINYPVVGESPFSQGMTFKGGRWSSAHPSRRLCVNRARSEAKPGACLGESICSFLPEENGLSSCLLKCPANASAR